MSCSRGGARQARLIAGAVLLLGSGCAAVDGSTPIAPVVTADADPVAPQVAPTARPGPTPEAEGPRTLPDPEEPAAGATGTGTDSQPRPAWLGTRVLPLAPDGFGQRLPTPPELVDRRLGPPPLPEPTPPPPPADGSFRSTVAAVPAEVAARSTWSTSCPVTLAELRYLTVTFVGFDTRSHTGELLVHADVADDVVRVFEALHAARFPLEEVRIIAAAELDLAPTGDGNVTSAFVCRPTVGGSGWSEHAYGRAIDLNPFHNPYVRGDIVLPELAGAYRDRSDLRPGMVVAGDAVTSAFAAIGWGWGGDWSGAATDPMHFSATGR